MTKESTVQIPSGPQGFGKNPMENLHKEILKIVNESTGIKATELICAIDPLIIGDCRNTSEENINVPEVLNYMVNVGMIIELEYVIPLMPYRIKSMYFPAGTILTPQQRMPFPTTVGAVGGGPHYPGYGGPQQQVQPQQPMQFGEPFAYGANRK